MHAGGVDRSAYAEVEFGECHICNAARQCVACDAGGGDRELAARVRSARICPSTTAQRVRRRGCTGTFGLGRHIVCQVMHVQHVAAGKYARHARLQTLVHHGAARTWVQLHARGNRKLVLGN